MDKNKKRIKVTKNAVAPGIDLEDSFGEEATKAEVEQGEYTKVTRFSYDEYDPSEK